jgi:hypothetical protein
MGKDRRKKIMRTAIRIGGLAAAACAAIAFAAPIFAQKAPALDAAAAMTLAVRSAELAASEKGLPAARKPATGTGEAERARAAEAYLKAGVMCHDIQRDFAEPMIAKADEYLRASLAYRETALARAYLGSAHIIQARDAASVISKVAEVDTGLKEVDAAVESAPDDILVRAIRVECTVELPEMFKRLDTVSSDLKVLLEAYSKSPESFAAVFPPSRAFELKAKELGLRGKASLAAQYRKKAAELAEAAAKAGGPK